ncbi:MAG: EAL domain-containing protein [Armatimonadota bacterium]|nr:EAL domain-containing protein [Armatimonadota bacterium]
MRALIAEDDPVSRHLLEAMLVKWGYTVVVATNGSEAWGILNGEDAPRLAILDWMMPDMDGLQVCKEIRKQTDRPYIYILLLTARSGKQDIVEGMTAGADDYIAKPFNSHELKVRLRAGRRIIELQAELMSARAELQEQATHDALTGLPNRLLFSDRLTQRLALARRSQQALAVMFLDLDRFKIINDTLGHNVGDGLLKQVAERLGECLREVDTLARMGGDEFTVILGDVTCPQDAVFVADRVLEALSEPFNVDSHELYISASIGISLFPTHGSDVETLVKNADTAMYRAKEGGRNRYQIYSEPLNVVTSTRLEMESGLRRAIEKEELVLHYQPRVSLKTGETVGVEALIRWQHPDLGLLPPDQFLPMAEETGLIIPVSEWALRAACVQNKAWQSAGYPPLDISVNVSTCQLQQSSFVETVQQALEQASLEPRYLSLELTEGALISNPDMVGDILRKLKEMMVRVSIDDFGVGHSSLSYLKRFLIDSVKIDRSFVQNITSDPDDAAIAGAIVAMAHSLKLKVIAEGVETLEQLEFLRSLNCDEMQGYFVSRPVPAEAFVHLLEEARRPKSGGFASAA